VNDCHCRTRACTVLPEAFGQRVKKSKSCVCYNPAPVASYTSRRYGHVFTGPPRQHSKLTSSTCRKGQLETAPGHVPRTSTQWPTRGAQSHSGQIRKRVHTAACALLHARVDTLPCTTTTMGAEPTNSSLRLVAAQLLRYAFRSPGAPLELPHSLRAQRLRLHGVRNASR
jgi:hypothetical protein